MFPSLLYKLLESFFSVGCGGDVEHIVFFIHCHNVLLVMDSHCPQSMFVLVVIALSKSEWYVDFQEVDIGNLLGNFRQQLLGLLAVVPVEIHYAELL